jgi:hypothetical protein
MPSFINSEGNTITTRTIKEFQTLANMPYCLARALALGKRGRLRGWCSTAKRAKRQRERFMTVLVHKDTGVSKILGQSVKKFARDHGLCLNELSRLVNGKCVMYRGWILKSTLDAMSGNPADAHF